MLRHYYATENLDSLQGIEKELISHGFSDAQIHVVSEQDAEIDKYQLHQIESVLKKDVVHSTEVGAIAGGVIAFVSLIFAYFMDWVNGPAGWMPFIFLAIVILGFCTWEGGFIGIQTDNVNFRRFRRLLAQGKHVLFVDIEPEQKINLDDVIAHYPDIQKQGVGEASPGWLVHGREKYHAFMKTMP